MWVVVGGVGVVHDQQVVRPAQYTLCKDLT